MGKHIYFSFRFGWELRAAYNQGEYVRVTHNLTVHHTLVNDTKEEVCFNFTPNAYSTVFLHLFPAVPTLSFGSI